PKCNKTPTKRPVIPFNHQIPLSESSITLDRLATRLFPLSLLPMHQYSRTHSGSCLQPDSIHNSRSGAGRYTWHFRPGTGCSAQTDRRYLQPPLSERVLLSAHRISNCGAGEPARSATVDHRDRVIWNHRIRAGATDENDEC